MDVIRKNRRAHKQLAMEALGLDARFDRIWHSQVGGVLQDTRMATLPSDPNLTPTQNPDGSFPLMFGYDPFGAEDAA